MAGTKMISNYHITDQFSAKAGEALTVGMILAMDVDSDGNPVVVKAANRAVFPLGVTGNAVDEILKSSYEEGDPVTVNHDGIVPVKMTGSGSQGGIVVASAGLGAAAPLPDEAVGWVFGVALSDWVANQVIPVKVSRNHNSTAVIP